MLGVELLWIPGNRDTTITSSKTPVEVSTAMASGSPLTGITADFRLDTGYDACALGPNGAVWCWGYGAYGQLGIGDESNSSSAVPVVATRSATPVTGFTSISRQLLQHLRYEDRQERLVLG